MSLSASDLSAVREILEFMNAEFSTPVQAYLHKQPQAGEWGGWHIVVGDYTVYTSEEYKLCKQACYTKFPNLQMIFVYLSLRKIPLKNTIRLR